MPMPLEYSQASHDFDRFVEDARIALDHTTRHQTYQTIESVFRVFRRRLALPDAIAFAGALPPVLRAIFVADWNTEDPVRAFSDRAAMTREVQQFRKNHDFSPDDAIAIIASILKRNVDPVAFGRTMSQLPEEARAFWAVN